ncbi:homogentisate solanesyltransferase, chloroplastic-like [Humulus lupulus]|uniref:homogentisate solanesyltransferase, chloroplastic-like n=1 Tax=Humulus lupulus TaxID=3486 RepID=UPI002B416B8A|nr:homogentisate solanesyltransferase, chloroplastic-like [Humulus lupulus]
MAFLGSGLLLLNYVNAIVAGIMLPQVFNLSIMLPCHAILALSVMFQTWVLDQSNFTKEACQRFYQFIWILHYSEYIVFPFI